MPGFNSISNSFIEFKPNIASTETVEVGFEYQQYGGFAEAMYNTTWERSPLKKLSRDGDFSLQIDGLKPGIEYQYRAVVKHPAITMRGDHRRFRTKPSE